MSKKMMTALLDVGGHHFFVFLKLPMARPNAKPKLILVSTMPTIFSILSTVNIPQSPPLLDFPPKGISTSGGFNDSLRRVKLS